MNIIQYNIRGLENNRTDINTLYNLYRPSLFCIQETHIKDNHAPTFQNYNIIHNQNSKATQGVAFLIKNNIKYSQIQLNTELQAIAITINIPFKTNICNIYVHPNRRVSESELQDLIEQIPMPRIILGDFNAHNRLWGSSYHNQRGQVLETILSNNDLICINKDKFTYYHPSSGTKTNIDLTICNLSIESKVTWKVLEQLQSDHSPILLSTMPPHLGAQNPNININYSSLNWDLFLKQLEPQIHNHPTLTKDRINSITSHIVDALKAVQVPISNKVRKRIPWWSPSLSILRREKKKAFRRFFNSPTDTNREAFNQKKREFRNEIKEQKKLNWSNFINSTNSMTTPREFWQQINKFNGKRSFEIITALNINGRSETDPKEIANALGNSFANSSNEHSIKRRKYILKATNKYHIVESPSVHIINQKITRLEFNAALAKTKNTSAPGFDQITYAVIKRLPEHYLDELLEIYNNIFSEGVFPQAWKIAKVIPLQKNNTDPFDISSYRPISLLSCFSKLLEKILAKRLQFWININNLMNPNQMGFQTGKSTTDALVKLSIHAVNGMNQKCHTDCIALDLSKAFDKCWPETILAQLKKWGLKGNMLTIISSFLRERKLMISTNEMKSNLFQVHFGVPQGSPLSALLFTVAINGLCEVLSRVKNVEFTLFADDIIIYSTFKKKKSNNIQSSLKRTENWCKAMGFEIAPHKNQHIHFCRLKNCPKKSYSICNVPIQTSNELKYLGVTFDDKLKFHKHIENSKARNTNNTNIIKILANNKNGLDPEKLVKVTNSIIRSSLEYGCQVFTTASTTNQAKLNAVYNNAIRISLGAIRTSPTESIHTEANTYELKERFYERCTKYLLKSLSTKTNPIYKILTCLTANNKKLKHGLQKCLENLRLDNIPIESLQLNPTVHFPPSHLHNSQTDTSLSRSIHKNDHPIVQKTAALHLIHEKYKNYNKVYTDGSKTSQSTTFAIYSEDLEIKIKGKISNISTIFQAEALAIAKACNNIAKFNNTVIFTDSLSSVTAIGSADQNNATILEIKNQLNSKKNIKIAWIPSHVGIIGNEKADQLANESHENPDVTIKEVNVSDLFTHFKNIQLQKRQAKWARSESKLFEIRKDITIKPPQIHRNQEDQVSIIQPFLSNNTNNDRNERSRQDKVFLTRLRIGHTIDTHRYIIDKTPRPGCTFCQTELTVKHLLIDCKKPERQNIRISYKTTTQNIKEILDVNTANIEYLRKITSIIL